MPSMIIQFVFGMRRLLPQDSITHTAEPSIGVPSYMSPEQITGGEIDRRTDIFSAGIVLYQLLTEEKPFTGSGPWTIAKKIIQDEPLLPSSINPLLPNGYDEI